jgi:hypothetical protein
MGSDAKARVGISSHGMDLWWICGRIYAGRCRLADALPGQTLMEMFLRFFQGMGLSNS